VSNLQTLDTIERVDASVASL